MCFDYEGVNRQRQNMDSLVRLDERDSRDMRLS